MSVHRDAVLPVTWVAAARNQILKLNFIFRNNICYGATNPEEISDEEIIEMAKKSNALEFINQLPDGLDTQIGERNLLHL